MFEIKLHLTGDTAEAETFEEALVAADTLARDAADARSVPLKLARRTLQIAEDGTYAGVATALAQEGYRAPLSAAWSKPLTRALNRRRQNGDLIAEAEVAGAIELTEADFR